MPSTSQSSRRLSIVLILALLLAGCSTPVGVRQLTPHEAYTNSLAGPLSQGVASSSTTVILNRFNLAEQFQKDPAAVIRRLHEKALLDHRRDILFALSELCYIDGERLEQSGDAGERKDAPDSFLLAAVYAYYSVLDTTFLPLPSLLDHNIQAAGDQGRAEAIGPVAYTEATDGISVCRLKFLESLEFPGEMAGINGYFHPADRQLPYSRLYFDLSFFAGGQSPPEGIVIEIAGGLDIVV